MSHLEGSDGFFEGGGGRGSGGKRIEDRSNAAFWGHDRTAAKLSRILETMASVKTMAPETKRMGRAAPSKLGSSQACAKNKSVVDVGSITQAQFLVHLIFHPLKHNALRFCIERPGSKLQGLCGAFNHLQCVGGNAFGNGPENASENGHVYRPSEQTRKKGGEAHLFAASTSSRPSALVLRIILCGFQPSWRLALQWVQWE